jgi:hypothetical protein
MQIQDRKGTRIKDELVKSTKKTFEKLCSGVDDPMQAPAFDHYNQDPFLGSEYTIQELHFAIKNLRVQSSPGRDEIDCPIIRNLPNLVLEILLEIYNDILEQVFPDDWKTTEHFLSLKRTKPM